MSIGGHQSARALKDEWLSPPAIVADLGVFDLDPCAPVERPWDTAKAHYDIRDNGLLKPWHGRVWCNPPYGRSAVNWLKLCADHGDAIALIFARTETEMFVEQVWKRATALLFIYGRLHFHHVDGTRAAANAGAPSVLVAYGQNNLEAFKKSTIAGKRIRL